MLNFINILNKYSNKVQLLKYCPCLDCCANVLSLQITIQNIHKHNNSQDAKSKVKVQFDTKSNPATIRNKHQSLMCIITACAIYFSYPERSP